MATCGECNKRYDQKEYNKCPFCGSTSRYICKSANVNCPECNTSNSRIRSRCQQCGEILP